MTFLEEINPFKLILVEQLPLPTDYGFVFNPLTTVGILAGIVIAVSARNRFDRASTLLPVFALMAASLAGACFIAQKFTLTYSVDAGCPLASKETYTTVRPLFVPEGYEKYLPSHGYFDGLSCNQFNDIMLENAAAGWFTTIGLIVAFLAIASVCLGIIFIGAIKAGRKAWPQTQAPA